MGDFIIIVLMLGYFVPTCIAFARKHNNAAAIGLLNIATGWTIIGWVACLVWSATSNTRPHD